MPATGRLGHKSQVPVDSHGCPGCPHSASGPAVNGSGNVDINGYPALRVGDKGVHSACCGQSSWEAARGSTGVFINGRAAHRKGDAVEHCGGTGKLAEGSPNVFIGEKRPSKVKPPTAKATFRFVEEHSQEPVSDLDVLVNYPDGSLIQHTTNAKGMIVIMDGPDGGYHIDEADDAHSYRQTDKRENHDEDE